MDSKHSLGDVLREVKRQSSIWASQHYHKFGWQGGYAAFSVGASERSRVTAYIANQEEHHRVKSSADELRELLAEHGIEYDARYFE
jgi:REP element-mobilizing transposase RayT